MIKWYAPCEVPEPIDLRKVDIQEKRDNTDTKYDKKSP